MYGLVMADLSATEPASDVTAPAAEMLASDQASTWLGIRLTQASPGRATVMLEIEEHHCNGLGVCHGGFLFTLADTAMAFATNAGGHRAFATNAEIDFIEAARVGDRLTATCTQIVSRGKAGVSDVTVTKQDGSTIAVFRGRTLATKPS
jgi:acyl-CoA thioesterase